MPFWIFCREKPILAATTWLKWTLKGFLISSHNVITEYEIMFWFLTLDLEWKIIYVGSAESEEYDQVLDSVLVGPVPAGRHMFVFQVRLFLVSMYAKYVSKLLSHGPYPFPFGLNHSASAVCCERLT